MKSMTGMGRAEGVVGGVHYSIEIKSVNQRYSEVFCKLPSRFYSFESLIAGQIRKTVARGKVEVWIGEAKNKTNDLQLNKKALLAYYQYLQSISKTLGLKEPVTLNQVLSGSAQWMTRPDLTGDFETELVALVKKALQAFEKMRQTEGAHLEKVLKTHLKIVEGLKKKVEAKKELAHEALRVRLFEKVKKITGEIPVDQARLAQEIALQIDRSDVTEELKRLESHFIKMKEMIASKEPSGRPLDFLMQEMNREWNTLSSKTQSSEIAHFVVEAKSEMEKMREQIQNIE